MADSEYTGQQASEGLDKDTKMWGMLCHLLALAGYVVPFGNIIGPLVIWLIKKQEFPFVDSNGKKSLNWQITLTIAMFICIPLIFLCGIGAILMVALGVLNLVLVIIASVRTNNGEDYRYPWSISFIK
ncbi:MAG TPA: DUF4870 domain-containing protein [Sedimentisphaerales bacterium]|nr:DUF4870 domain-containing protein [Sedimentisphaerales bacterium]